MPVARGAGPDSDGASLVTEVLLGLAIGDPAGLDPGLSWLDEHWDPRMVPMVLDTVYLSRNPLAAAGLVKLLEKRTGESHGYDVFRWYEWLWSRPEDRHPGYARFRARLYALIDPRFERYFEHTDGARIRLDEVLWGGVRQDGIPPLRNPKMLIASEAGYLDDHNVVFGISVNDDARAYPKRILAWHEMFTDTVGGEPVAGVYCTLCGTVILYRTTHLGTPHRLGTSGFLYRSNKLMYDQATQSLWSTMRGEPVIGPLAGSGIRLERLSVVTSTWGEWKRRHPDTRVLSLDTGHQRDYAEGAAYREYFATDELMFAVSRRDGRLKNKDEVLGLLLPGHQDRPLALSAEFLSRHPVHHRSHAGTQLVVITDTSGANRVYASAHVRFERYDGESGLIDAQGMSWTLSEDALSASDGRRLPRLPAHRAFWFGWYAAFPDTVLVH